MLTIIAGAILISMAEEWFEDESPERIIYSGAPHGQQRSAPFTSPSQGRRNTLEKTKKLQQLKQMADKLGITTGMSKEDLKKAAKQLDVK